MGNPQNEMCVYYVLSLFHFAFKPQYLLFIFSSNIYFINQFKPVVHQTRTLFHRMSIAKQFITNVVLQKKNQIVRIKDKKIISRKWENCFKIIKHQYVNKKINIKS